MNKDQELFQSFIEESRANIQKVEEGILALEENPENIGAINDLLTQFHTIKGGAKLLGIKEINKLCHAAESFLEDFKNEKKVFNQTHIEILFESEDILNKLFEILVKNLSTKEEGKSVDLNSEDLIEPVFQKLGKNDVKGDQKAHVKEIQNIQPPADSSEKNVVEEVRQAEEKCDVSLSGKFLTFRLEDEYYSLKTACVKEIIGLLDITSVPHTSNFVKGIINLRGKVVPVIDLRLRLGMPQGKYGEETCTIIIKGKKGLIGIIVDSVTEVIDVNESEVDEPPDFGKTIDADFIVGVTKVNEEIKILLDIEKIISNDNMVVE